LEGIEIDSFESGGGGWWWSGAAERTNLNLPLHPNLLMRKKEWLIDDGWWRDDLDNWLARPFTL
jgi:hypothetical protein